MTLKELIDMCYQANDDPMNMDLFIWLQHKDGVGYDGEIIDVCENGQTLQICLKHVMKQVFIWDQLGEELQGRFENEMLEWIDEDLPAYALKMKYHEHMSKKDLTNYNKWLEKMWEDKDV